MRFATVNFYQANRQPGRDIDLLNKLNLDTIGFQEVWRHKDLVDRKLRSHRLYTARRSDSKASNEVAIGLHKRNQLLGYSGKEVSDVQAGEETKIFKSRWITVVRFRHEAKKYAHINYHGNAVVQSRTTGRLLNIERTREWIEAAREIERTIRSLKKRGFVVLVTGDFNYRRYSRVHRFALAYWSPQRIFKRTGLTWIEKGLDYIAWSKSERRRGPAQIVDKSRTGSDHDWIIVELV